MTLTDRMERGHLQPATALPLRPAHMLLAALALLLVATCCAFATSTRVAATFEPTVVFHLHRLNLEGQADPLRGSWRIDSIFYQ